MKNLNEFILEKAEAKYMVGFNELWDKAKEEICKKSGHIDIKEISDLTSSIYDYCESKSVPSSKRRMLGDKLDEMVTDLLRQLEKEGKLFTHARGAMKYCDDYKIKGDDQVMFLAGVDKLASYFDYDTLRKHLEDFKDDNLYPVKDAETFVNYLNKQRF